MIRAAVTVLCLPLAAPVCATQDQWPALFDVTGVASDDVLNVRAAPTTDAEIIGTLAPDAADIEVIAPNDRHSWGLVNLSDGSGWVSLAFLQRQPGQWLGAHPAVRSCFGTEPFWTLERDDSDALTWRTPDRTIEGGQVTQTWASQNRRDRHSFSGLFTGGDEAVELLATTSLSSCADGMSDRRYGISVDVLFGGIEGADMLSGCCTLAP